VLRTAISGYFTTTTWMFVYTMQPVVQPVVDCTVTVAQPVVRPVGQPVVSRKRDIIGTFV